MRRFIVTLSLVALALAVIACPETKTPVEAPAFVSPTPLPTPVSGLPATLTGRVLSYGKVDNVYVDCQGKRVAAAADGSYAFAALQSGWTTVNVSYSYVTSGGVTVNDGNTASAQLAPGANSLDLWAY